MTKKKGSGNMKKDTRTVLRRRGEKKPQNNEKPADRKLRAQGRRGVQNRMEAAITAMADAKTANPDAKPEELEKINLGYSIQSAWVYHGPKFKKEHAEIVDKKEREKKN